MTALSLFDVVLVSADANRAARLAEPMIEAAIGELKSIEAMDTCLASPDPAQFDRQTATLLRGMYEVWARDTTAVLDRVLRLRRAGQEFPRLNELRDAQGRVLAMLDVTLEDIDDGRRQFETGRTYSREEVRTELRLGA